MGAECPTCGKYGAYKFAITATGEPAIKNSDIIARKLECGHVLGSTEYMEYRKQVAVLEAQAYAAIHLAEEKLKKAKTALWTTILKPEQEA